jgi:hypothetical protein
MVLLCSGVAWALEGVGVWCSGGRGEWRGEQRQGVNGRRRKEELFDGALLLKPHEAMDDGGVAAEMVSGNSSSEAVGAGKVASWAPLFGP